MAESESPIGNDQTVISDVIFVGDMSTVGAMSTVPSELFHVQLDKVVYLFANLGYKLKFQVQPDIGFSSRFSGPYCSPHVDRISHVVSPGQGASSSWRINPLMSQSVEQP